MRVGSRLLLAPALVAVAILPNAAAAQTSPRDAVNRFVTAWNERRWVEAAEAMDVDQFDRFRQDFIARARRQPDGPMPTVEELRRRNPDLPRDVAEYQIQQMQAERRRFEDPTPFEFAHVRSVAALRGLTSVEAAARWLESRDPAYSARLQYEQAGCPVPADLDQMPSSTRRVIGVVTEGEGTAYAIVKEERSGDDTPEFYGGDLTVIQLKERRGRWLVSPRGDLLPDVSVTVDPATCKR
jgi:hypothetical protein